MTNRIETLLSEMKNKQFDGMFVTSPANFYYLSNYQTDPHERLIGVYLNTHHKPLLILPGMEEGDAKRAGWEFDIIGYSDDDNPWEMLQAYIKQTGSTPKRMGIEYDQLNVERYQEIKQILPEADIQDAKEILAQLRVLKNDEELQILKEAAELADFGIATGVKAIEEGKTEIEVIAQIEYELKKKGVQGMSFSTMVLSGNQTASPHGTPGLKKIEKGDLIMFDLGVIHKGYCSDMTRTFAYQSVTDKQRDIYNTVLEAQLKAIEASKVGVPIGQVDKAARDSIKEAGYGEYFTHRIGHGIGIECHEYPSINGQNQLPLAKGMCYTIEPGVYVPNTGGVRIEDMIYMGENGPEVLTKTPKELQIIK